MRRGSPAAAIIELSGKVEVTISCWKRYLPGLLLASLLAAGLSMAEDEDLPEDWQRRLEMLRSVPYLSFTEREADETDSSVTIYIPERTFDGYNFYNSLTFQVARLLDMKDREVHSWQLPPLGESERGGVLIIPSCFPTVT